MTAGATPGESPASVGFIGLGNMGWPMAANLVRAGFPVVVSDLDPSRQAAFVAEHGGTGADGADDFRGVSAVVTMLPTGEVVRAALIDAGVAAALAPGTVAIDMSSSAPFGTRELAAELDRHGVALVDAPVSGGMAKAADATLTIMVGASDDAHVERVLPFLEAIGAEVTRTGPLGSGHAAKLLNNYVLAAGFVAAGEALVVARKLGLDAGVMVDVLNASSGRNVSTEKTFVEEVLTRRFEANFTFELFVKDLRLAAALAEALEVDTPVCAAVRDRLARAGSELGWGADYSTAVALWERAAGVEPPR